MISVVVYGRNDSHGYNLQRRAALSFNCIAEVLTDPDDEIVFVDYNTPDELPTFVEAIADTLTDRCLERLRVFRVPAAIHAERFAERTHLPALEPIARNAGVRRARPDNRWLLLTNTDMLFLPLAGGSLSEICGKLSDGFYGLPRFELPEWLWERLPRTDPRHAMKEIARLGPALHLDEPTLSSKWIRFDAPGDFQLVLREDYLAIDGLDEDMLLGYHVDSNLSRRMSLHRGSVGSVEEHLAGYHCNHNREPTIYHGVGVANDLTRFFLDLEQPDLPDQRATWGLPDAELEEVRVRERVGPSLADTLVAVTPEGNGERVPFHVARVPLHFAYDSGHVLPFVADALAVSPLEAAIGYLGANQILREMLAKAVESLGFETPLQIAEFDDDASVEELAHRADVFVVDFGVDMSLDHAGAMAHDVRFTRFPPKMEHALDGFDRLVELERDRLEAGLYPRRFVLVHSWTVFWDAHVIHNFDCSHTTAHSRVRRGTVRLVPIGGEATRVAIDLEKRLVHWTTRQSSDQTHLPIRASEAIEVAQLRDYGGFGDGWSFPDEGGVWTQGSHSHLSLAVDTGDEGDAILALSLGSVCVDPAEVLTVTARANGGVAATRDFRFGDPEWRIPLPPREQTKGAVDLTFDIEDPTTPLALGWSADDTRLLGINLRRLTLEKIDYSVETGERVAFSAGAGGERLLRDGWSWLEQTGVWTDGENASLALRLKSIGARDAELIVAVEPFVIPRHPKLELEVSVRGEPLATHVFHHGRPRLRRTRARLGMGAPHHLVRTRLPRSLVDDAGYIVVDLRIRSPASPQELGLSDDTRQLGLHLVWLEVEHKPR